MVDKVHQRSEGTAGRTFRQNRERFITEEDFVSLDQPGEIRRLGFTRPQGGTPESLILLTRRGYLKLVKPVLTFNDAEIHDRSDMLSLTDMWKAHGSDPARQPSNWLGSADVRRLIEALDLREPGNSGVQAKRGGRGIGGVTFAHWQIAMAYAKYLSPEFHMWCNTVVREQMGVRGDSAPQAARCGDAPSNRARNRPRRRPPAGIAPCARRRCSRCR